MKKWTIFIGISAFAYALCLDALPAQVVIIRDAEKDSTGNLNERGAERAGALAPFLTMTPFLLNFGTPAVIFAARPTPNTPPYEIDDNTTRCLQTVGPVAALLKLPLHAGYGRFEEFDLANVILNNPFYEGKNLLICWHFDRIRELAIALGVTSADPFPDEYGLFSVIDYSPSASLTFYREHLLFGDGI